MDQQQDLRIGTHLKTLWNGKWLILLTTVIALVGVVAFADSQPGPTFRAVATIRAEPPGGLQGLPPGVELAPQLSPTDRNMNTNVLILQSRNVMERALIRMNSGLEDPPFGVTFLELEELRSSIGVRAIPNTNLLEVTARAPTPQLAEERANAVVLSFIEYVKEERIRIIEEALQDLDDRIRIASSQDDIDDLISVVIPDLQSELGGIVHYVEQTGHTLGQLQPQGNASDPKQTLEVEIPRLQAAAARLDTVSRGLQVVQVRLEEGRQPTALPVEPSLEQEATRVKGTITELNLIHNELQSIRTQVNRLQPAQDYEGQSRRAEEARSGLRLAAQQLDQVSSDTLEQARQIHSVRRYIDSVNSDLQRLADLLRDHPVSNSEPLEQEKATLKSRLPAHTVGLTTASDDLRSMRGNLDLAEYGKIITARGHIETANTHLRALNNEIGNSVGGTSVDESLSEIMTWTRDARRDLQSATDNYLSRPVGSGTQAERDGAMRAGNEIGGATLTLEVGAARARSLSLRITDPLLQARLNALATRLTTAHRNMGESSARLQAIGQVGDVALASQVGSVRQRIQDSTDDLLRLVQEVKANGATSGLADNVDASDTPYSGLASIAWSLDVASRQLEAVLRGSNDPLLLGEMASHEQQLVTARQEVQSVSERVAGVFGGYDGAGVHSQLAHAESRLKTAVTSLNSAASIYQEEVFSEDGVTVADVRRIKESIDIAAAVLGRVGADLDRLRSNETDSFRFGQLVVLVGRIGDARSRAEELASQLQSLQGSTTPQVREMRRFRRQLELSLLHPQETGITQVDSAVSPQARGRQSFLSQAKVPLAGIAGVLLGSLGVILKAQIDPTVRSHTQLRDRMELESLGVIPKGKPRGNPHPPMVSTGDQPAFCEALQLVGAGLSRLIRSGVRSFLITSAAPKEGKTMLAVNVAHVLSKHGHRVLLVDGNLRKPEVGEVLDIPEGEGLAEALAQQQNPLDYVVEIGGYYVLQGGKTLFNPVELLSSTDMIYFLQQAQRTYDVVLVDGPPTLGFAEFKAQDQGVSASILVVRAGVAKIEMVEAAKSELEAVGIPVAATVLNFAPADDCNHLRHNKYTAGSKQKKLWLR